MKIAIEPSTTGKTFNIAIYENDNDAKAYAVIKGCKIVEKADGTKFVSAPSTKPADGETQWTRHAFISAKLQDKVLELHSGNESGHRAQDIYDIPLKEVGGIPEGFDNFDDDIPF